MSRAKKGPYVYRRDGRAGLFAYIDRDHRHIPLGTEDDAVAHAKLAALLHGRRTAAPPKGTLTTSLIEECVERSTTAHAKKTAYEIELNLYRIGEWLEARDIFVIEDVSKAVVEDYKTARHRFQKRSASRVNRELDAWKKMMAIAVEQEATSKACLEWFAHLREPRPIPHQRGLTRVEINKLLRAITPKGYRDLVRTVVGSGLRDEEMHHLEESDLHAKQRQRAITVTPKPPGACECCPKGWSSKSYRFRTIPVSKETMTAALAFVRAKTKLNLDKKRVWNVIDKACDDAKVKHCSLHDFRRACASHWLASGIKIEHISAWLGHADLATTQRYLRIVEKGIPDGVKLPW